MSLSYSESVKIIIIIIIKVVYGETIFSRTSGMKLCLLLC